MTIAVPALGESWYVVEWLIRLAMLAVVPFRRSPAATRSWLLLIFILPGPGLVLYLLIGRPRFPAWRTTRFAAFKPKLTDLAGRLHDAAPAADDAVAALARRLGLLPAVAGNTVEFLTDYDAIVARLIADIDAARGHVRLLVYIFADDAVGQSVADALARAIARGVRCHVLFDPVGSAKWRRGTRRMLDEAGVEWRETLPFRLVRGRTRRDMRNHRKLFLIDGAIGYGGSINLVAKDFRPGIVNRELVARVMGPAVAAMTAVFLADWYLETEQMLDPHPCVPAATGAAEVQILPSGAEYQLEGFETLLIWQVHAARDAVTIVAPYFIPDEDLLGALRTAVQRGVTIDLIVSAVVDQRLVNLAQSSYYDELLGAGIRIHRYRDELLHAKTVTIDGRLGVVGSSNVDIRSFQLNEEVSLLLFDAAGVAALGGIQQEYIAGSDPIELTAWRRRGRPRQVAENIARLVSPLL